ncbi:MAG: peptidoglycan-binding protein LysM [Deltaproteobacteria bacterium]|nr:peptidoglycan-binding protein LysM [Deltaproteobacteria bacterium]
MGMFDFVKGIGSKLFGSDEEEAKAKAEAEAKAAAEAQSEAERKALAQRYADAAFAQSLAGVVTNLGLEVEGLKVEYSDHVATVHGQVASNELREKIILALGNIAQVSQVDDRLEVVTPEPEAQFYVVKKGDTLSKIAKEYYGDFKKYPVIFEANKPMLKDPDLIYPGQTLRIPPL